MEANNTNPEVHGPSPGPAFGGRLAVAREARGLTLADVAHVLRLPAATLMALEASRYEDLPAPVFVRGYLRAYARLLGISGEELVGEYDRRVTQSEPVLRPTPKVRQAPGRAPYIRGAAALIAAAMVLQLGSWWYSRLKPDDPAQSLAAPTESEQPTTPASALPPPQTGPSNPGSEPSGTLQPNIQSQSLESEADLQSVLTVEYEQPMEEVAAAAGTAPALGNGPDVTVDTGALVQQPDRAVADPGLPDLPIAPPASDHGRLVGASRAPTGEDVLTINSNDESWAEVVDANDYQLLYYLLRPGRVYRLQGQAPFRVFLGNAPAVELSLHQKRFDHTPFQRRNNTARFSVDDR